MLQLGIGVLRVIMILLPLGSICHARILEIQTWVIFPQCQYGFEWY